MRSTSGPSGFLNVDKPAGWTSRQVVDHVRRFAGSAKVGHAGTLDPLATGVLVVCVGRATRLVPLVQEHFKTYRAEFLLGRTSTTDDVTGEVTEIADAPDIARQQIEAVLPQFVGTIEQLPPSYSAVKVGGQRAYRLARRGESPRFKPRWVTVHSIDVLEFTPPRLTLQIECGSGTYIRSLGRDLGQALGCGAVMSGLVRTRVGPFRLEEAVPPGEITARTLSPLLIPAHRGVDHLPTISVDESAIERLRHGRRIRLPDELEKCEEASIAILGPSGVLVAVVSPRIDSHELAPRQVFV